jgi:lipopolysaccharide/colanic/teichoic acid biosynthesis glycosyltransferase
MNTIENKSTVTCLTKGKTGITGLAQVNGWRGETDSLDKMQKRIEFDLAYHTELVAVARFKDNLPDHIHSISRQECILA